MMCRRGRSGARKLDARAALRFLNGDLLVAGGIIGGGRGEIFRLVLAPEEDAVCHAAGFADRLGLFIIDLGADAGIGGIGAGGCDGARSAALASWPMTVPNAVGEAVRAASTSLGIVVPAGGGRRLYSGGTLSGALVTTRNSFGVLPLLLPEEVQAALAARAAPAARIRRGASWSGAGPFLEGQRPDYTLLACFGRESKNWSVNRRMAPMVIEASAMLKTQGK